MDNFFDILVTYNSTSYNFSAELISTAYSYKIEVDVFGKIISFEPDEESNFRAVIYPADSQETERIDKFLLAEIARQLVRLFKE